MSILRIYHLVKGEIQNNWHEKRNDEDHRDDRYDKRDSPFNNFNEHHKQGPKVGRPSFYYLSKYTSKSYGIRLTPSHYRQYTWLAHNSLWNIFGDITLLVARGVVIMLGQVQLRCQPGPMGGRSQLSLRGDIEGRQERGYKPEARCRQGTSS